MKVTFRGTLGDRLSFMGHALVRNPMLAGIMGCLVLLLTFGDALPAVRGATAGKSVANKVIVFVFTEVCVLFPMFLVMGIVIVLLSISRRNKTLDCERTITLGEEGFVSESQYGRTEAKWAIVQKLVRTHRHLFIYTNQSSAVVIPRRAFADQEQWDAFYEFCRKHAAV